MTVTVRYIVSDVQEAIEFYVHALDFDVVMHPGEGFALLSRGQLRLALSAVGGSGGGSQARGSSGSPQPGGWNRFQIKVDDLSHTVARLKRRGATFRSEIVQGNGGQQILLEDPSGNPIEVFEPYQG